MLPPNNRCIRLSNRIIVLIVAIFVCCNLAFTQTRSFTGTYAENFNSLLNTGTTNTWTNDSTIDGWQSSLATYAAGNGSSNNGGLYSFGNTASADRAIGSLASSGTGTVTFGVCFTNNTGFTLTNLAVNYTGEQWRVGSTPALGDTIAFSYQAGVNSVLAAGAWTNVTALNFASPTISPNNSAVDGNVAPNRTIIPITLITGLSIANGSDFCLRWTDIDNTGADYGASIDDLTVTLGPTAASANVRGRVMNDFGRPISRASITILNTQSGETKSARSNQFGYFNFNELNVGDFYVLQTERKGYQFEQNSFQLLENLDSFTITGTRITY
jgi:Carboxypeptidase regulatory-like domain